MANVSSSNGLEKRPKLRFPGFDEPWKKSEFREFAEVNPKCQSIPEQFYYIDLGSVEDGELNNTRIEDVLSAPSRAQRLLSRNDILFQTVRPYQQNNYLFCEDRKLPTVASTGYAVFRTQYDVQFLYALIHTKHFLSSVLSRCTGTSFPAVSASDIEDIIIWAPSVDEQQEIGELFRLLNVKIRKQKALVEALKKYKRGVMRAIFRDKAILFSETTKWKSVHLGDECTFFSGGTPKSTDSSFYGGAIPFIRSGEIHSDKTELFLTDDGLKYSSAKMVSKGDLIIALYGATSGEVDISKIDGAINQAILCIRPSWINKVYLKYLLEDRKDDILNTYLQGGQGNLSAEIIKNLIFDIPDECSQLVVVDFLNTMDRRINSSIRLMENLITLRSGLMQQLFI